MEDLEFSICKLKEATKNTHQIVAVATADDERVAMYRMKKVRNHWVYSQNKKAMLDLGENWLTAITLNVVKRALRGKYIIKSLLITSNVIDYVLEDIIQCKILNGPILVTSWETMIAIVGVTTNKLQSIAALVNVPVKEPLPYELTPNTFDVGCLPRPLLILDNVRSADNVGVILRTCFTLGVPTILCSSTTFSAINTRSARASMGTLFHVNIFQCLDLPHTLKQLRALNIIVIGTSPSASETLPEILDDNWGIVLGNEDVGSSNETLGACSKIVCIPQVQGDSLSVVAASAICIYEMTKLRRQQISSKVLDFF